MGLPHLISIVGAGPGDPELLTIKALNRLKEADVILYDALVGEEFLDLANPAAKKKYVGKIYSDGQNQCERQEAINNEILHWASEGKRLVRLKSGDPMVFARGAEEIRFCRANNINFEIIPGISAGLAASALFGIPLTERGKSNMLLFYTANRENGGFYDAEPLSQVIQSGSPVIIYMGLNNLPKLATELSGKGIDRATSVQILSNISKLGQKIWSTNIGEVAEFLKENKPETPSLIIIGRNVQQI
jgi:uroporphyrin-III C-methyltransferase